MGEGATRVRDTSAATTDRHVGLYMVFSTSKFVGRVGRRCRKGRDWRGVVGLLQV